jgi:hypothetical protein
MSAIAQYTEDELLEAERLKLARKERWKADRAKRARERYAERKARGELAPRSPKPEGYKPRPRRSKFDAEDYAEEWRWLTQIGMPAEQIITRSNPSRVWFFEHVRMLVTDAICTCGDHFNPADSRQLTRCNKACGLDNGNRRDGRERERLWLL